MLYRIAFDLFGRHCEQFGTRPELMALADFLYRTYRIECRVAPLTTWLR